MKSRTIQSTHRRTNKNLLGQKKKGYCDRQTEYKIDNGAQQTIDTFCTANIQTITNIFHIQLDACHPQSVQSWATSFSLSLYRVTFLDELVKVLEYE